MLIGLNWDTVAIQAGKRDGQEGQKIEGDGTNAVLMNKRGKVREPAMPKTVSALLVLRPIESDIPDHARPKKAMVTKISRYPGIPVAGNDPLSTK